MDYTQGRIAGNDAVLTLPDVDPVDTWDRLGKSHDIALATANGAADLVSADYTFASGAIMDGVANLNASEVLSGVAVGALGTPYHLASAWW
jgi:hypothetical protein